ncbi:MAG: mechanosensitive ion channel domain-containing protein [Rubripirellula sp.]
MVTLSGPLAIAQVADSKPSKDVASDPQDSVEPAEDGSTSSDAPAEASGDATPAPVGSNDVPKITLAEVEKDWASVESNSSIDDAVKELLRPIYKQAMDALKQGETYRRRTTEYRESIDAAPRTTASLRAKLDALPSLEKASQVDPSLDPEELQKDVAARKSQLADLRGKLEEASSEVSRGEGRANEVTARVAKIGPALSALQARLASPEMTPDPSSPRRVAERLLLISKESELIAEQAMLKEERASQFVRKELAAARENLLTRQVENDSAAFDALDAKRLEGLRNESNQIASTIQSAKANLPKDDRSVNRLVEGVEALADEFRQVVNQSKQVSVAHTDASQRLSHLDREYEKIQSELKLDAGGGMAQVLFDLQDQLLNPAEYAVDATKGLPKLDETRIRYLRIQREIRGQDDVVAEFSEYDSRPLDQMLEERLGILTKLAEQYRILLPALMELNLTNDQFLQRAESVRGFITQQLFWVRSSSPVSAETFQEIPAGLSWLFSSAHWTEFSDCLVEIFVRKPVQCLLLFLSVAGLCFIRPWLVSVLEKAGLATRRVSTDRYSLTWQALVVTLLLALPIPMVLFFLSWAIQQAPDQSAWLRGLGSGLQDVGWVSVFLEFLGAACRPGGLGTAHFGRRPATLKLIRKTTFRFGLIYVPAHLLVASTLYGDASQFSDSVGRFVFILAHIGVAALIWRLFGSRHGILAALAERFPNNPLPRFRPTCMAIVMSCPIALMTLAWRGYVITAIELSLGAIATLAILSFVEVAYLMVLRWFALKRRKLALAERIESWRARQELSGEEDSTSAEEVVDVDQEEDQGLDLDAISEQTRRLLQFLFALAAFVMVVVFWSGTIPLISVLETIQVPLPGGLNMLEVCQSVMIIAVTTIAVKNLPGLLELSVLRATSIEAGTRYAIVTLCRYALMAIGFLALANVLDIDWSKFGWIAAALSVGLGFGMQEVVTNFVCGIILLFERPVRVGDVVTVEGTTGTVTRIRMRATTITNWDRQEFVVPNKNLITNTILNWTLTATTSRIVINVGAAYGTDTDRARQILVEVAQDHPVVLDDPQPIATFEEFADSSLTLCLRAYVPDLGSRLTTITELHTEIDKRFSAEGIEIAFPQQDLHLRNGFRCEQCGGVSATSSIDQH